MAVCYQQEALLDTMAQQNLLKDVKANEENNSISTHKQTNSSIIPYSRVVTNGMTSFLKGFFFGTSLFSMAIVFNIIQLSTLLVYPFNRSWVSALNASFCGAIWQVIDFAIEKANRARFTYSGQFLDIPINYQPILRSYNPSLPKPESALVICNHLCTVDWALINGLALRYNMLPHCKYFLKKSLEWVPLFGVGMKLAGFPFLNRNWAADQHSIESIFRTLREDQIPCWLISFLEGTRLTPEKLHESQSFCESKGFPIFDNVLYPRKKGFIATVKALRNTHVNYVYDLTIAYYHIPSGTMNKVFPSITELHCKSLEHTWRFHVHVERISLDSIDIENTEEMEKWIEHRWNLKDQLLAKWKSQWPKLGVNGVASIPYYS